MMPCSWLIMALPLTQWGIAMLFKRLKKRTGIEGKRVSAHSCRRYMATTQLANGRSPLDVKRQLGHTSLKMTDHYASLSVEQLKRSHEKYSLWRDEQKEENGSYGSGYWQEKKGATTMANSHEQRTRPEEYLKLNPTTLDMKYEYIEV